MNRFFRLVTRGLYWKKFEKRLPDNYTFEVRRLHKSAFSGLLRHMMDNGGNGPHSVGEGVFSCAFLMGKEDPFTTLWLMWFYESIPVTVATGPPDFFEQFAEPTTKTKAFGLV